MAKIKLDDDFFEGVRISNYGKEVEVDDETAERWKRACVEHDDVECEMMMALKELRDKKEAARLAARVTEKINA